jgi:anti-sigma factor RsiW
MAEKHPDELELLSYLEEELDDPARREVAEHLVACRTCAEQIRRLEAGRGALQAAPLLELPDARRVEILSALPERADRWRLFKPVKRALVIAAPVAGAAALVGVFVLAGTQLGGGGGDDEAGDVAGGAEEQVERTDSQAEESIPFNAADATPVRLVQGPAAEVVRMLEDEGITAEIVDSRTVVADARAGEVRAALGNRPSGGVAVYVR